MTDYTGPEYKNLYEEILLDYHYRFPKFHPIPYPFQRNYSSLINNDRTQSVHKRDRNSKQKTA